MVLVALVDWLMVKQDQLRTQDLDHTEKVVQVEQTLVAVVAEWQLVLVEVEQVEAKLVELPVLVALVVEVVVE